MAAPKANLGSFGTPNGSGGGQLSFARGLAANQTGNGAPAGSVYVAEGNPNHRISQFDRDGNFIRAWGVDVVASGQHDAGTTAFEICEPSNSTPADVCKAGVSGVAAGQLDNPHGIAIDQANGFLYVTSVANRRIDVFSGEGEFAGAFGWGVATGAAALEVCTTSCQAAAAAGEGAGNLQSLLASVPAIDPSGPPGILYVPDIGNARIAQYATTVSAGTLTAVSFIKAFGWNVDPAGGTGLEICTSLTGCQKGTVGAGAGQFGPLNNGSPTAAAVDSTGAIYVASGPVQVSATCSEAFPCRIQKFAPDASSAINFGPASGEGQLFFTSGASNTVAGLGIAIDPSNDHVFVLRKASASAYYVIEYDSSGVYVDTHPSGPPLPGASSNNGVGLAVGIDERVYSNLGAGGAGRVFILGPVPNATVELVPPVEAITSSSAMVDGTVTIEPPGDPGFEADYTFEYSSNGVDWIAAAKGTTGSAAGEYDVSATLRDLEPNTQYQVRLVATTGDEVVSAPLPFKTLQAPPRVVLSFAEDATQTTVGLGAHIDPEGLKTSYHIEWGPTDAYGNRVPAVDRQLGAGNSVVIGLEQVAGLTSASTYHFRVVATSAAGTTYGPDQHFQTLNSCGLTDGRCFELVSPPDKGPVGAAGDWAVIGYNLQFQAAPQDPAIAYTMAYGLPDSSSGGEVLYQARRDASGWDSSELSAPVFVTPVSPGSSTPSIPQALSSDLSCEVFTSTQALTADAPQATLDIGRSILYRRDAAGAYTAITDLAPTNQPINNPLNEYILVGISDVPGEECERVYFTSKFQYPGVPGAGITLYEWDQGVLKNAGVIPGPGGPVVAEAVPGALGGRNYTNAVSPDATQVIFTAARQVSPLAQEIGKQGVFVRTDGLTADDVSLSQTATPNDGPSRYEYASDDGRLVFFTARYGLAGNGTSSGMTSCSADSEGGANGPGCDLYRYSTDDESLVDLSVPGDGSNAGGAGVIGVLGGSDDGSRVYFAARGQLVPGEGSTEAENLAEDTYSVYLSHSGGVELVGHVREQRIEAVLLAASTKEVEPSWSSRVTPSGSHLLFESAADVTGHDSEGRTEAYLYSAQSDSAVCVSCRKDGQPSVASTLARPLTSGGDISNRLAPPVTLTDDGARVFFLSPNRLAVGATEGRPNLYKWSGGQVSFIASSAPSTSRELRFAGASANGDELYFTTVDRLTWEDTDGKLDLYNARVGGGIPQPPAPPSPCDPLLEGGCHGAPSPAGPAGVVPGSAGFVGSGNEQAAPKKQKKKKKKGTRKGRGKKKQQAKGQRGSRGANKTGGAGR